MSIPLDYISIAIFTVIVLVAMVVTVMLPKLIGVGGPLAIVEVKPKQKPVYKYETYECGEIPVGDARVRYDIEYYIFPIVFLVFDVVTAFLLLWALVFWQVMYTNVIISIIYAVSLILLSIGLVVVLSKEGVVEWLKKVQ